MKHLMKKLGAASIFALSLFGAVPSVNAGPMDTVLDGMFANFTPPSVIDNQFSGGLNLGSAYIRSPISSVQLFSIDPPRITAGCGGIDAYFGSYTHISADKLIQFMRHMAQNAATIAFQLALESVNPQLSGMLKAFNDLSQKINSANKNSCELARGILSFDNKDLELGQRVTAAITNTKGAVQGLYDDFAGAMNDFSTQAGKAFKVQQAKTLPSGKKETPEANNITWEALTNRERDGYIFDTIVNDSQTSKEIVMSLIGTTVTPPGSDTDTPTPKQYVPFIRLSDLLKPTATKDSKRGVFIYKCLDSDCLNINRSGFFETNGIEGYVNMMMIGTEVPLSQALPGSIIFKMKVCVTSNCSLTAAQSRFLNSLGNIPAITLLRRSQRMPLLTDKLGQEVTAMMVTQIGVIYADAVINLAITTYTGTDHPKPDGFQAAIEQIRLDSKEIREKNAGQLDSIRTLTAVIDEAIRSNVRLFQKN